MRRLSSSSRLKLAGHLRAAAIREVSWALTPPIAAALLFLRYFSRWRISRKSEV